MRNFVGLFAAAISVFIVSHGAGATTADMPPPGYPKATFVDRSGCVYALSEVDGWNIWVQRLDDERQPICDREPTRFAPDTEASRDVIEERT